MRSTKGMLAPYKPAPPPTDLPPSAQRYLDDELNKIANIVVALMAVSPSTTMLRLDPTPAEPTGAAAPVIVYTDATSWDPGSGEGYYYLNMHGVWTPLG